MDRVLKSAPRISDPVAPKDCERCGGPGPTRLATFRQNIGMLVVRQSRTYSAFFCKACVRSLFWSTTLTTLVLGWWGTISFFVTPVFLIMNIVNLASGSRGRR